MLCKAASVSEGNTVHAAVMQEGPSHRFKGGALDRTLQTDESGCQPVELIQHLRPHLPLSPSQHPC